MNFGIINQEGTVIGTYLHGFLDQDQFRKNILSYIRSIKDIPEPQNQFNYAQFKTKELNKLADLIKNSIDLKTIEKELF